MNIENQLLKRPKGRHLLVMSKSDQCSEIKRGDIVGCFSNREIEDSYFEVVVKQIKGNLIKGEMITANNIYTDKEVSFSIDYVYEIYSEGKNV
jgi:hypothetical protein